jgi:hypothetical protein
VIPITRYWREPAISGGLSPFGEHQEAWQRLKALARLNRIRM